MDPEIDDTTKTLALAAAGLGTREAQNASTPMADPGDESTPVHSTKLDVLPLLTSVGVGDSNTSSGPQNITSRVD